MATITATFAKNNIGELWKMSKDGPVVVKQKGVPVAVVLSPKQFEEITGRSVLGRRRNLGMLAKKAGDFDSDAFLNTDIS